MINFACKKINLDDIIKCGLGLTKKEFEIFKYFLANSKTEHTTIGMIKKLNLGLTTIQKAVKKLFGQEVIIRHQKNLQNGGYIFTYECNSKMQIRKKIKQIIQSWSTKVENKIDRWRG